MDEPPLEQWEREGVLLAAMEIARILPHGDVDRDVRPRLRRLTRAQREVLDETLSAADDGEQRSPAGGLGAD
jgi:hypothetical protein